MFPLASENDSTFHDPPKASEPTPDEGTAKLTMPAMITEAECNRKIEAAIRQAKREQMEADCRAVETFPVLAASLRDELVAAIRAALEEKR